MLNKNFEQKFLERYNNLNEKQREAVDATEGSVLVIAGPGSGKTELLAIRTANILKTGFVEPQNILLLTFTDSGSFNMRERLISLIGESGYRVSIYTFHAFASDIINKYSEYFWNGATFKPATEVEKFVILEKILSKLPKTDLLSSIRIVSSEDNLNNLDSENTTTENRISYTYLSDISSCIGALKKGNLSGDDFKVFVKKHQEECEIINNLLGEIFLSIKGKRKYEIIRDAYLKIYKVLEDLKDNTMAKLLSETLSLEINLTLETGEIKKLKTWRDKYFCKDENNNPDFIILKDSRKDKIKKWLSFAEVYNKYQIEMYNKGLYDFDDMIYKVARELEKNVNLRYELQEKFQYIMIDEFQDTSDSQFDLVKYLTDNYVNEGSPNILAVGDDDQAIYKFQGAKLDNITKFVNSFKNVKFVALDKNYRSTQNIIDRAKNIINRIEDRLENRYKSHINKNTQAANKKLTDKHSGKIIEKSFDSHYNEYDFVCNQIKDILNNQKIDPKEISIIARNHATLKQMANFLIEKKINFSYEKKENCFDKIPIRQIITIIDFINSGLDNNIKDELLPEILSYNFWNLQRLSIWKIAEAVRNGKIVIGEIGEKIYQKQSWLNVMLSSDDQKIKNIAEFLIHLIEIAKDAPLEIIIDKIIGTRDWEIIDEYDDSNIKDNFEDNIKFDKLEIINNPNLRDFVSPFREYYFGKNNFENNKIEYLDFLFALRTFIGALREYKQGQILYCSDLNDFVNIHKNNNIKLEIKSPFATSLNAITLQTAHKSKGLEYEYVFIIGSNHKIWENSNKAQKIGLPNTLPLLNESDNLDDKIRLYFVAMTRAKHTLYITNSEKKFSVLTDEKDDNQDDNSDDKTSEQEDNQISESVLNNLYILDKKAILEDEKVLLKRLLENYKMPVTHMINFLNFSRIGPSKFIEQNLLRFPQAMSSSSIYGSAIHEAMQNYYLYKHKYLEEPNIEKVFEYFERAINRSSMTIIEKNKNILYGKENLEFYINDLKNRQDNHILSEKNKQIKVEVDMKNEGCLIDNAELGGKIDKIIFDGDKLSVIDIKTGKGFSSWENVSNNSDKIKLHFYKYQLAYYYILLKRSKTYNNYSITNLHLEFVEKDQHNKINILSIDTNSQDFLDTINRVETLIKIIYNKIVNLDFPDISKYMIDKNNNKIYDTNKVTIDNIINFENDLLENNT